MKKTILFFGFAGIILLTDCASSKKLSLPTKSETYKIMYEEKPVTVLIMPPINRTDNVEAKDIFHATLAMPICNAGYYVIPPFLSMEILQRESAYDAELFLETPLTKFGEVFGADLALFTIIHSWKKTGAAGRINVEIEYIFKSVKTDSIAYQRKGNITLVPQLVTPASLSPIGLIVAAASMIENTISNAITDNAMVGLICNNLTLLNLPAGPYSPLNNNDGDVTAVSSEFKITLSGKARAHVNTTTQNYWIFSGNSKRK